MVNYNTNFKKGKKKYKIVYGYHIGGTPWYFVYSDELRRPIPVIFDMVSCFFLAEQYGEFHNLARWWRDNS